MSTKHLMVSIVFFMFLASLKNCQEITLTNDQVDQVQKLLTSDPKYSNYLTMFNMMFQQMNGTVRLNMTDYQSWMKLFGAPTPPSPPKQPANLFAKIDQRIAFLISSFLPNYTQNQVAAVVSNRTQWGPLIDILSSSFRSNCKAAIQYYMYLEDEIVLKNDNNTFVTNERLYSVLPCKEDCNFKRLLSAKSAFGANITVFVLNALKYLPPKAASQCKLQFPTSVTNLSPANILNNINEASLMTPAQMGAFNSADSLSVAQALSSNSKTLNAAMTKSLGKNIPENQPLDSIAKVASGVPLSCFNNTNPSTLVNLIGSMDLDNMDSFRKGYIASKISSSNNATLISNLLSLTTDSTIINSISSALLASIDTSSIPAANLPKAFQKSLAKTQLQSTSLSDITDSSNLGRILSGVTKTHINSVSDSKKTATIVNLVQASITNGVPLTSAQRSAMLSSLLSSLSVLASSANVTVYLNSLSTTQLAVLYPLFIEANATILTAFSQLSSFATVISSISDMSTSECCSYSRAARALFASYVVSYLFDYQNLGYDDLYNLGPCLVSVLSSQYLQNIDPSTFISYYSTLGNTFQPDASQTTVVQTLIASYAANSTVMSTSSQDTLVFSTLSDLALFYPFSTYASSITTWSSNGGSLMSTLTGARSSSNPSNQLCQVGLTNTATTNSLLSTYGSTFVAQYISSVSSKRKKRSTYTLTCTDITAMGSGITSLTTDQIATLSTIEFYSCQTTIGSSSNSWSTTQLSSLASIAKTLYGSAASISDSNITALNIIMTGFASTDLSSLVLGSTSSISALGALNGWTSAQLTALSTPLNTYISIYLSGVITSDFMTSAANLLCCLSSSQITEITDSVFTSSVSALAKISLTCPNIANWYSKAKSSATYGSNLYLDNSKLSELGAIIGGIGSDITSVSADSISSITTTAWTYMPTATVNQLSTDQLSGFSIDQVSSLMNSPNYASFSGSILSALQSASGTVTSSANGIMKNLYFVKLVLSLYSVFILINYTN